jgi:hypothetical protein
VLERAQVCAARLLVALRQDSKPVWITVTSVALFSLLTIVVFLALNPFLYSHPVRNTGHMVELGRLVTRYNVPADQRLDAWARRWDSLMAIGLERTGFFRYYLHWPWIDKILAGLGALIGARAIVGRGQSKLLRRDYSWCAIWLAVTLAGILYWTPFSWPRWYLPLEPCWATLEGIGFAWVLAAGWQICQPAFAKMWACLSGVAFWRTRGA